MDYLEKYNLTEMDINDLKELLDEKDINELTLNEVGIKEILDYLNNIGIKNIKDVLITAPYIIYSNIEILKNELNEEAVKLINENTNYIEKLNI